MLPLEDHNTLKVILLYKSLISSLSENEFVENLNSDEKLSLQEIVLECFEASKNYKGSNSEIKDGCMQILSTKEDIARFCPKVNDIITP